MRLRHSPAFQERDVGHGILGGVVDELWGHAASHAGAAAARGAIGAAAGAAERRRGVEICRRLQAAKAARPIEHGGPAQAVGQRLQGAARTSGRQRATSTAERGCAGCTSCRVMLATRAAAGMPEACRRAHHARAVALLLRADADHDGCQVIGVGPHLGGRGRGESRDSGCNAGRNRGSTHRRSGEPGAHALVVGEEGGAQQAGWAHGRRTLAMLAISTSLSSDSRLSTSCTQGASYSAEWHVGSRSARSPKAGR